MLLASPLAGYFLIEFCGMISGYFHSEDFELIGKDNIIELMILEI